MRELNRRLNRIEMRIPRKATNASLERYLPLMTVPELEQLDRLLEVLMHGVDEVGFDDLARQINLLFSAAEARRLAQANHAQAF